MAQNPVRYAGLLMVLFIGVPLVGAHSLTYPTTPISPHVTPAPTFWYGTYAGGHVVADGAGQATVALLDAVWVPVGALVCQDLNLDFVCGGLGELFVPFCATVTITNIANGGLWDPTVPLYVYQDSTFVNCGTIGFWFVGVILHT